MLRMIRHARLVLCPRSASAHIAVGYGVPAVVWAPDDGENWHLNYGPKARVRLIDFDALGRALAGDPRAKPAVEPVVLTMGGGS
jgi:ADP-heptose:LPS heptosyltransferase